MERESFVFYKSFYEAIKDLPRDIQGEIYTAIMEYGLYGREAEDLKPIAKSIFILIRPLIDKNNTRYENGKKGASHGEKGGKPKKQTPNKPQTNPKQTPNKPQTNPKQTPNDNVNVNDNVNDNVNEEKEKFLKEFPFADILFMEPFLEWLDYKRERRESYKSAKSLKMCYDKLVNLSGDDPIIAMQIVQQSMANNWQGLFELKNNPKQNSIEKKCKWKAPSGEYSGTYKQYEISVNQNRPYPVEFLGYID